jgi:uncharacterized membrane protein
MWTRMELKTRAKEQMKGRYFNYLGVSLVPTLTSYAVQIPITIVAYILIFATLLNDNVMNQMSYLDSIFSSMDTIDPNSMQGVSEVFRGLLEFYIAFFQIMAVPFAFISIAGFIVTYLVIYPVMVGMIRWFIRAREERTMSFSLCFSNFKKGYYLKTVGSIIYYMFFLWLWSLALFIPGIIKAYSYRMIPYILADNPRIGARRALKLSCMMTKGHKLDIFVLDLSFLGWYILGYLACFVGVLGVIPYQLATNAELYDSLKKSAVENGYCTMEELGYVLVV